MTQTTGPYQNSVKNRIHQHVLSVDENLEQHTTPYRVQWNLSCAHVALELASEGLHNSAKTARSFHKFKL